MGSHSDGEGESLRVVNQVVSTLVYHAALLVGVLPDFYPYAAIFQPDIGRDKSLISPQPAFLLLLASKGGYDGPLRLRIQSSKKVDFFRGDTSPPDLAFRQQRDVAPVCGFLCFLICHHLRGNQMQTNQDRLRKGAYVDTRHRVRSSITLDRGLTCSRALKAPDPNRG